MNQHFVPRAYLKHFAICKGRGFYVPVYDKQQKRFFTSNISRICSEIDLYTLREENSLAADRLIVEKLYANGLEPLYQKAYTLLTDHSRLYLSDMERAELLIGIFQLYVRNPKLLHRSIAFHTQEILRVCVTAKAGGQKGVTYLNEDFSFRDYSEEAIIRFFAEKLSNEFKEKHFGGIGHISEFHHSAVIEVGVITDEATFMTGDHPVAVEDRLGGDEHPLTRAKVFPLPLNSKTVLTLHHDRRKSQHRIYRYRILNGSVAMINQKLLEQSSRFVIASREQLDNLTEIREKFLDDTPTALKIDSIRQILAKFPEEPHNKASRDLMRTFLARYEQDGFVSDADEAAFVQELHRIKREFVQRII